MDAIFIRTPEECQQAHDVLNELEHRIERSLLHRHEPGLRDVLTVCRCSARVLCWLLGHPDQKFGEILADAEEMVRATNEAGSLAEVS